MSNGIRLSSLLTLLFIGLKLAGCISWNWFWVLFPSLFGALVWILVILSIAVFSVMFAIIQQLKECMRKL
jgi:hypothetical protein